MALDSGLKLLVSANDVVCCPGDENGFISPRFFSRVEWAGNRQAIPGWDKPREVLASYPSTLVDGAASETASQDTP